MNVGDVKYVDTMGKTNRILEATLISLATKGFLKFEKENKKKSVMTIVRVPDKNIYEDKEKVSAIEREVFMAIGSRQELEYSDYFYKTIQRLQNKIKNELSEKYDNKLFFKNFKYSIISIVVSVILFIIGIIVGNIINPYIVEFGTETIVSMLMAVFLFFIVISVCGNLIKTKNNKFITFIFILLLCQFI